MFPPLRFAAVEEGVYRSGYPTLRNLRFLRRLRLRTVVALTPAPVTADLEAWCDAEEVTLVRHVTVQEKGEDPLDSLSVAVVASVVSTLIDPDQLPCLFFCMDGIQLSGVVAMCLRKLQHWHLGAIFAEHLRFASHFGGEREREREDGGKGGKGGRAER